ncbi:MAG: preprotein translocase subunit SecA [Candidatus Omnitrophica bacterium]|nr:preprotein translocase subunit SecA [Candidatus Omnitrophota bacterium]
MVEQINLLEPKMQSLSNEQMRAKTEEFKEYIKKRLGEVSGEEMRRKKEEEVLAEILPEAFALVREAGRRTIGLRHFDVQLMGGVVLHKGKIAEMATGEGKTLVATLPVYLNALLGRGVHVVTVNDYLARRDAEWMGPIYKLLGLSVGVIQHDSSSEERKKAYLSDVTYGTNNEFGFDYLRDNMVVRKEERVQRELFYAIVDEVDSILIDEARTPLIISGPVAFVNTIYEERRPVIEELVHKQRRLIQNILNEAEKLWNQPGKEYLAGVKFLIALRGEPKNKRLLQFMEENKIRRMIQKVELDYIRDKRLHELDEELFYVIDEKSNSVDFSEKGRQFLGAHSPDLFVLKDIAAEIKLIEENENISWEEKLRLKNELFRKEAEKQERIHADRQLIRAYELFENEVDYVVKDGKVVIVDEFTGRLMPGRRWSDGLHEAVEAKERITPERESQTLATITLQNYFRMYKKLAGMTGTAFTEAQEFHAIYKLDVIVIPTNRPLIRTNYPDVIYKTEREKFKAVVEEIMDLYNKGRPVLVGTLSIEKSERLSRMLKERKIPHNVLNAKYHELEAHIVAQAGRLNAVTIATNMAGRGTDILLGGNPEYLAKDFWKQMGKDPREVPEEEFCKIYEEMKKKVEAEHKKVVELGGLHVIGTERHEARRIDNQLRGRAGRQGDPGSSRFYLSLEDDLLRLFGSDRLAVLMERFGMEEGQVIEHPLISKAIETAQKRVEEFNFSIRKQLLEYDNVMNRQREVIYEERRLVLEAEELKSHIYEMLEEILEDKIAQFFPDKEEPDYSGFCSFLYEKFLVKFEPVEVQRLALTEIKEYVYKRLIAHYEDKERLLGTEQWREFERFVLLQTIDERWKEHLYNMDALREGIGLRAYGQRDPLVEYQHEAFAMFEEMIYRVKEESLSALFKFYGLTEKRIFGIFEGLPQELVHQEVGQFESLPVRMSREETIPAPRDLEESSMAQAAKRGGSTTPYRRSGPKIGRNDPCPCGSGKKYKKCCGK